MRVALSMTPMDRSKEKPRLDATPETGTVEDSVAAVSPNGARRASTRIAIATTSPNNPTVISVPRHGITKSITDTKAGTVILPISPAKLYVPSARSAALPG